jgi:hypothetical protein
VKRFIRALRTVPKRVWWLIGAPVGFLSLLAVDRHVAASAFVIWLAYLWWSRQKHNDGRNAVRMRTDEETCINPSTGLPMYISGGVDSAGYQYGEDTIPNHRRDDG